RCRARDVADRRDRHQPRDPGRGRGSQPARGAAGGRRGGGPATVRGREAPPVSDARRPVRATHGAGPYFRSDPAAGRADPQRSAGDPADRPDAAAAGHSGSLRGPRRQARAGSFSRGAHSAIALSRLWTIASKNCSVVIHACSGPTRIARSLVICPPSTVSTHTRSSVSAKRTTSGVPSNLPRYLRPPVQAKIEAIGLVEVALPCWCIRKWRVTVPCAASASTVLPSGVIRIEVISPSEPKPWATWSDWTSPS